MSGWGWSGVSHEDVARGPNWFPVPGTEEYQNYVRLEAKQRLNNHKLRIRYVPCTPGEDIKHVVLALLNSRMLSPIPEEAIISCVRAVGWDGMDNPMDIVVNFANEDFRNIVYHRRKFIQDCGMNDIEIFDELIDERAAIWRFANNRFGLFKASTSAGCVRIISMNGRAYLVRTMDQMHQFVDAEHNIISEIAYRARNRIA